MTNTPDVEQNRALPAVESSRRLTLPLAEMAERSRQRWEDTPQESWFSPWSPIPGGVRRGPYAKPTRDVLTAVRDGLQRRVGR